MRILIVSLLLAIAMSACTIGFWNPLDNACVNGRSFLTQCVHGHPPTYTMLTPRQTAVF